MEKYRGKTLEEWRKYIKEDKHIGIRATKYIVVLEEIVADVLRLGGRFNAAKPLLSAAISTDY